MRDILDIIKNNHKIKPTPLLRKSGLSSARFKEYYNEVLQRGLIKEITEENSNNKYLILSERGFKFLERYRIIIDFIDEFDL